MAHSPSGFLGPTQSSSPGSFLVQKSSGLEHHERAHAKGEGVDGMWDDTFLHRPNPVFHTLPRAKFRATSEASSSPHSSAVVPLSQNNAAIVRFLIKHPLRKIELCHGLHFQWPIYSHVIGMQSCQKALTLCGISNHTKIASKLPELDC